MTWIVYIVECSDGSLYTGITNDLARRVEEHGTGKGAKYTKHRGPVTVRYTEHQDSKGAALTREAAIKSLRRGDKLALVAAQPPTELCSTTPQHNTFRQRGRNQ
jgi:predicted GIY-YIG superfamily endonuclease